MCCDDGERVVMASECDVMMVSGDDGECDGDDGDGECVVMMVSV